MDSIVRGLAVFAVDGHPIGHVGNILTCCFDVTTDIGRFATRREAVFTVDSHFVTLVCNADRLGEYACRIHKSR
jgi:hypothetical protein